MDKTKVKQPKKFFLDCLLQLIKSIASIYDFVTLPFYYYNQRVRALRESVVTIRSKQIDPTDPSSPWQQVDLEPICDMVNSHIDSFDTYDQMVERSFQVYADRPCYGYRKMLEQRLTKKSDTGKIMKQVRLSDYRWITFAEFNEQIDAAMKGFLLHGVRSGDTIMLFADTRPEWQIASQALLRMNVIVGTMYSTLGTDGIVHSINETQVTHIVTQEDIVDKLVTLRDKIPSLKTVIYFEPNYKGIRSKSAKIRAGHSFEATHRQKNGMSKNFFNRALFQSVKSDNNYTKLNGIKDSHTQKIDSSSETNNSQYIQKSVTKLTNGLIVQSTELGNEMKQHDLSNVVSVKSNGITKVAPAQNGHPIIFSNSSQCKLTPKLSEKCDVDCEPAKQVNYNGVTTTKKDNIVNTKFATTIEIDSEQNIKQDDTNNDLNFVPFSYLLWLGRIVEEEKVPPYQRPKKGNVAVIMYTSGSTGVPKGVVITHSNIMATLKSFSYTTKDFVHDSVNNTVAAYLPLAHIFEFCIESMMLFHGVKFGFASPQTLTEKSPGLIPGEKGDLALLKPTAMIIVPLILDRIVQGVKGVLKSEGYFKEKLVSWLIEYKMYWSKFYYKTPLIDKLVCSKIASALGGRCRYVICGSAPLSPETQQYVRAALNLKLPQGFGTTETCASTTCQLFDDQSSGNVGLPVAGALIKLESWPEGDYHPTDKPHPRGEIVVGGEMIAQGYYKLDELTKEAFYTDNAGTRWYRTGDIGLMLPNGNLKIIDRKKDLVKLQNGEYVSLGKVESSLKSNKYLENFCAHANPTCNFVVALGPVNAQEIIGLGENLLKNYLSVNKGDIILMERNEEDGGKLISEEQNKLIGNDITEALRDLEEVVVAYRVIKQNLERNKHKGNDTNNNMQDHDADTKSVRKESLEPELSSSQHNNNSQHNLLARLCKNKLVENEVHKTILDKAKESNLLRLEIPKKIILLPDEWTAETGLVTAALKIRRAYIYKHYESALNELYQQLK